MIITPIFLREVEVNYGSKDHPERVKEIMECGISPEITNTFDPDTARFPEVSAWEEGVKTVSLYVACFLKERMDNILLINQRLIEASFIPQGFAPFCSVLRIRYLPDKLLTLRITRLEATCPKCFRTVGDDLVVPSLTCFPSYRIESSRIDHSRGEDCGYLVAKKT